MMLWKEADEKSPTVVCFSDASASFHVVFTRRCLESHAVDPESDTYTVKGVYDTDPLPLNYKRQTRIVVIYAHM